MERTLSIIKPEAVARGLIGDILSRFEHAGLKVVAAKLTRLDKQRAESFYEVHRERPFFQQPDRLHVHGPDIRVGPGR